MPGSPPITSPTPYLVGRASHESAGTRGGARSEAIKFREIVPPEELARLWTANSDARNYVVGDPTVKLAPDATSAAAPAAGAQTASAAYPD